MSFGLGYLPSNENVAKAAIVESLFGPPPKSRERRPDTDLYVAIMRGFMNGTLTENQVRAAKENYSEVIAHLSAIYMTGTPPETLADVITLIADLTPTPPAPHVMSADVEYDLESAPYPVPSGTSTGTIVGYVIGGLALLGGIFYATRKRS